MKPILKDSIAAIAGLMGYQYESSGTLFPSEIINILTLLWEYQFHETFDENLIVVSKLKSIDVI